MKHSSGASLETCTSISERKRSKALAAWVRRLTMNRKQKSQTKDDVEVRSNHPLVGVWVEEENDFHTSTVVYTITAMEGRFSVSGIDKSDGIKLRISGTCWDGEGLNFTSLFALTKHKSAHGISLI